MEGKVVEVWSRQRNRWTCAVSILIVLSAFQANAAELKPETVAAWDHYLERVNARLRERVRPGSSFLWTFEDPDRAGRVRGGEIVVAPAPGRSPVKVPGGLIHHWVGAMYLPGHKLDDLLEVTRDYDHYSEYYRPSVVESKTIARDDRIDRFSMRVMNKAFFLKTAMDADYQATNVRVDQDHFYSVARTTRVQEIEDYGQPGEHKVQEGEGSGYIWKLYSISRFEQRDAGVYVEVEAVALSRDIPLAARIIVDPIVRRVSRNSLLISLEQTQRALRGTPAESAARVQSTPGLHPNKASFFTKTP